MNPKIRFFNPFLTKINSTSIPKKMALVVNNKPHPLCILAVDDLKLHLNHQLEWKHNFGLSEEKSSPIIGKMFGVLVVETNEKEIGYLAAFSGKLAGGNHHSRFVPPIFDSLSIESFLNNGMKELTRINQEIKRLELHSNKVNQEQIKKLKIIRKNNSASLQKDLFDQYYFVNNLGKSKSLNELFKIASNKKPPSGAGECAAPKLLQYAFQNKMKPLAIAEFWWGLSPKSNFWKHDHFYPCCKEKCEPILTHMLSGIECE